MSDLNSDFKVNLLDLNLALNKNLQVENIIDLWNSDITLNIYNINKQVIKSIHDINVSTSSYQSDIKQDIYYIRGGSLLKTISNEAFQECQNLESVDFTDCHNLDIIGDNAFYDCHTLSSVDFSGCTSLSFDSFKSDVFLDSSNIKTVDVTNSGLSNILDTSLDSIFENNSNTNPINYIGIKPNFSIKLYNIQGFKYESSDVADIPAYQYNNDSSIYHVIGGSLLERILSNVFRDCQNLLSVDFTNCTNLNSIGQRAFLRCQNLKSVDFTNCTSLQTIGTSSYMDFQGCHNLSSVDFTNCTSLQIIGTYAFQECTALTNVDFTNCHSLATIDSQAFYQCSSLTSVDFTDCSSLQTIGTYAFQDCSSLTSVDFTNCSKLERINLSAFVACNALTSVDFTDCSSLKIIDNNAFQYCSKLLNLDLSSCHSLHTIDGWAFRDCLNLKSVDFTNCHNLQKIGYNVFRNCQSLSTINFTNCTNLVLDLENIIDYVFIRPNAFLDSSNIQIVNVTNSGLSSETDASLNVRFKPNGNDNNIQYIGNVFSMRLYESDHVFLYNISDIDVKTTSYLSDISKQDIYYIRGDSLLQTISNDTFQDCSALTNVDFTNCHSLETIGSKAFLNCYHLSSVYFTDCSSLKTIGNNAFQNCSKLLNVDFTDCHSLETIGSQAFLDCSALSTLDFTDCSNLYSIGEMAFQNCNALSTVDFTDCHNLRTIGKEGFLQCKDLSTVHFTGCSSLDTIGYQAFKNCYKLSSIDFSGCNDLSFNSFGDRAFMDSSNIKTVDITNSGLSSETDTSLNTIFKQSGNDNNIEYIGNVFSMRLYGLNDQFLYNINDIDVKTTSYLSDISKQDIYYIRGGSLLQTISNEAFQECQNLLSVDFTDCHNLQTIGSKAFQDCYDLSSVYFIDCSSLKTIGNNAFQNCYDLSNVDLRDCHSLETIGSQAFQECYSLSSVDFNGCTDLSEGNFGDDVFLDSSNIQIVNVTNSGLSSETDASLNVRFKPNGNDNNIQYIGNVFSMRLYESDHVFLYNISDIDVKTTSYLSDISKQDIYYIRGDSLLQTISNDTFQECQNLLSVDFTDCHNLQTIGNQAFLDCQNLESVDFSGCTRLSFDSFGTNVFQFSINIKTVDVTNSGLNILTDDGLNDIFKPNGNINNIEYIGKVFSMKLYGSNGAFLSQINDISVSTSSYLSDLSKQHIYYIRGGSILQSISNEAFRDCSNLLSVDFTDCHSLHRIGNQAFYDCSNLSSVDFSGCTDLSFIGGEAFVACNALTNVNFTNCTSLKSIETGAFQDCSALESLNFTDCSSLIYTSFSSNVFLDSSNIKTVNVTNSGLSNILDASLDSIFKNNSNTNPINYIGILPNFSIKLYDSQGFKYDSSDVADIPAYQYNNDSSINHVIGGSLLEKISNEAFLNCQNLSSLNFTNCHSLQTISNLAFQDCSNLLSVDFTNCTSLLIIDPAAFRQCYELSSVDFTNCSNLTTITEQAFQNCSALESVNFTNCHKLQTIGNAVFRYCYKLSNVDFSGTSLNSIGIQAFRDCLQLSSLNFTNCSSLTLSNIDTSAFQGSKIIQIVNITNSGLSGKSNSQLNNLFKQSTNQITYIRD